MKVFRYLIMTAVVLFASYASAHFGVIMPSDDIVSGKDTKRIVINLKFIHPFEQKYMNLEKPKAFGVMVNGKKHDLIPQLKERRIKGFMTWKTQYTVSQPGDHIFYMEPAPYWEPSEEIFIIHYTKVIVNAFGKEDGWDKEVGLKTEIVPLTRPYGLWAGNVFQGIVKVDGKPVPFANVEVEYYNDDGVKAPDDVYITQVIKADANGIFTYSMPKPGWWGFSALNDADYKLRRNGKEYPVEIGAVLWVKTREMKK